MREFNAILTIAYRDLLKFFRDKARIFGTLVLPVLFIGVLGGSLQASLGNSTGFNFLTFTFTGVFAQTLFQSTAFGIISLIEDRENDFSQEIFISPISRFSIIFGKIFGESLVALVQALILIIIGLIIHVPLTLAGAIAMIPVALIVCLLGGGFGLLLLSFFNSQRAANQVLPFLIFPQFFLAGVFTPLKNQYIYIDLLSRITPLRYAVDLVRNVFYDGQPEYSQVVLQGPIFNLVIISVLFVIFLLIGTTIFVRNERNR